MNGNKIIQEKKDLNYKGATVYRKKFDEYLVSLALNVGVTLRTSTNCINILNKKNKLRILLRTSKGIRSLESNIIVAADGIASTISNNLKIHEKWKRHDLMLAAQYEFSCDRNIEEDTIYLFYNEKWSNLGYGWIFPKKKGYTVGVGDLLSEINGNELIQNLEKFIH